MRVPPLKVVKTVTFLLVDISLCVAHQFVRIHETNNFYFKHFLLKSIFSPLVAKISVKRVTRHRPHGANCSLA